MSSRIEAELADKLQIIWEENFVPAVDKVLFCNCDSVPVKPIHILQGQFFSVSQFNQLSFTKYQNVSNLLSLNRHKT